jgi:YesN/AraC family two-component response regulator
LFGCEQFIKIYLEEFLIGLIRQGASVKAESRLSTAAKERSENDMVKKILAFMNENISKNLNFNDIREFSCMGSTNLKILFKEKVGISVMGSFRNLKIEEAKKMMREKQYNFTEIAEKLGYTSLHYFSRHFKRATGMTPSQYASSVKAKI